MLLPSLALIVKRLRDMKALQLGTLNERQVKFLSLLFDGHVVLLGVICIQCNTKPAPCQGPV